MRVRARMMVRLSAGIVLAASVSWLFNAGAAGREDPGVGARKWDQKMLALRRTLSAILIEVTDDQRYQSSDGQRRLKAEVHELMSLTHELNRHGAVSPDRDPSVVLFSGLFSDETKEAYLALQRGYRPYARDLLRSIPGYCIACHSRTNSGPSFPGSSSSPADRDIESLPAVEKGEFFAATRQYDRALSEFQNVISDRGVAKSQSIEWSNAIRYALAIAVRVKRDPELSKRIVEAVLSTDGSPFFLKEDARSWRDSVVEWSHEPKRTPSTEEGLHAEAVRLLAAAHDLQKYPADHSADVLYLRASAVVHDLLQLGLGGRYADEGLLMAGICYDVLRNFHIGEVQEIYFEACIRHSPHTAISESCYRRYEQSVYEGYTGSGGTHLPADVREKLGLLEALAQVKPSAPAPAR